METLKQKVIAIDNETPYVLICAYGTLRKNMGNWAHFLQNKSEYLGTFQTEPIYTMYGKHMSFPIVSRGGKTAITYDLFKIKVNGVLQRVHNLEGFTGIQGHPDNWYDVDEVETEFGKAYMYVQDLSKIEDESQIIESGDWKKRHLEK